MSDVPKHLQAKRDGVFFDIKDDFYESIDQDKHDQFLRDKEEKEEE